MFQQMMFKFHCLKLFLVNHNPFNVITITNQVQAYHIKSSIKLNPINWLTAQAKPHEDADAAHAKPVPTPVRSGQAAPAAPAKHVLAAKVEPVSEVG